MREFLFEDIMVWVKRALLIVYCIEYANMLMAVEGIFEWWELAVFVFVGHEVAAVGRLHSINKLKLLFINYKLICAYIK